MTQTQTLRLTLDVTYELNGVNPELLMARLRNLLDWAQREQILVRDTAAVVAEVHSSVAPVSNVVVNSRLRRAALRMRDLISEGEEAIQGQQKILDADGDSFATALALTGLKDSVTTLKHRLADVEKHLTSAFVPVEVVQKEVEQGLAYLRSVIEEPVDLQYGADVSIEVRPDTDDDRVSVCRDEWGWTVVNYTSEGVILDVFPGAEDALEPCFTTCILSDDLDASLLESSTA